MRNLEDLMGNLIGSKNLATGKQRELPVFGRSSLAMKTNNKMQKTTNRDHFLNLDPKISVVVEPEP